MMELLTQWESFFDFYAAYVVQECVSVGILVCGVDLLVTWIRWNISSNPNFENLLGKPPKVTHEPISKIICKQLDIKLGQFTQEELDSLLRKIKNRKAAGFDEIPPGVWKTREFDDILLRRGNAVYNKNTLDRWTKGCILPFPKRGDLGIAKNYWGITLTSIAAKIYNALRRNPIEPKIWEETKWLLEKSIYEFRLSVEF